jgi:anti-anti-sigma factor
MNISAEKTTIAVPASVDERIGEAFMSRLRTVLERKSPTVYIDCGELAHVTSSHINVIWQAWLECSNRESNFRLTNVSENLKRVLVVLDLAEILLNSETATKRSIPIRRPEPKHAVESFEASVSPTVGAVNTAMGRFVSFLCAAGVPEIAAFELQTIFYEIATNVRCHADLPASDVISVKARLEANQVVLIFTDAGATFDPTAYEPIQSFTENLQPGKRRGFGLAMVTRLSDSLQYERIDDGTKNQLTVTKKW